MTAPLQHSLPFDPFAPRPLPGIAPIGPEGWIIADDAYAGQMAEKQRLLRDHRSEVLWLDPAYLHIAQECLSEVLTALPTGFSRDGGTVICPDGRHVTPDPDAPLESISALIQEDICLLVKQGDEHVLCGALLCFPASWLLSEKAGKPLLAIHAPVEDYDPMLAKRVQRLFDGIRPGRPLWRFNALWYDDPSLFQPRSEDDRRPLTTRKEAPYFRSERQCLLRLPETNAVVFSIHTYVLPRAAVLQGKESAASSPR
ncbi:heme-dependent oxidative N-demethylase family protein [Pacificoceanicola onchidii]|uniref:heme-dependent oxidative N-demethylase family protein n=1 Tax=Pacificoceanicola onchidii TaxID=2562685 RepID=UPI0010A60BC2|nr:DUF3445 domain-containing protein [Pacificoceanicola onchidii]